MLIGVLIFLSTFVGAITGLGGGVIIKPVLALVNIYSVEVANFYSSVAVFFMSFYAITRSHLKKEKTDYSVALYLAIGAFVGGVVGNAIFTKFAENFTSDTVTIIQAVLLGLVLSSVIFLTLKPVELKRTFNSRVLKIIIGLFMGTLSVFIGVGGGPINVVVLAMFFKMNTKDAATNSLIIILVSQFSNIVLFLFGNILMDVEMLILTTIIIASVIGGIFGRSLASKINTSLTKYIFVSVLVLVVCLNIVLVYTRVG